MFFGVSSSFFFSKSVLVQSNKRPKSIVHLQVAGYLKSLCKFGVNCETGKSKIQFFLHENRR